MSSVRFARFVVLAPPTIFAARVGALLPSTMPLIGKFVRADTYRVHAACTLLLPVAVLWGLPQLYCFALGSQPGSWRDVAADLIIHQVRF